MVNTKIILFSINLLFNFKFRQIMYDVIYIELEYLFYLINHL